MLQGVEKSHIQMSNFRNCALYKTVRGKYFNSLCWTISLSSFFLFNIMLSKRGNSLLQLVEKKKNQVLTKHRILFYTHMNNSELLKTLYLFLNVSRKYIVKADICQNNTSFTAF